MIRYCFMFLPCLLLAACSLGNDKSNDFGAGMVSAVKSSVAARQAAPAPNVAVQMTRAQLNGITEPLIRTKTEKTGQISLLYIAQRNGNTQVWFAPDRVSFTLRAGLIVQTKGLGNDIYATDAPAVSALLEHRGGTGPTRRIIRRLDGANAQNVHVFDCTLTDRGPDSVIVLGTTFPARHYEEACSNAEQSFANDYWIDAKGVLRASRQWIGEDYGTLFMERLID